MTLEKYNCSWVGIDSGREGLWKEPIWKDVIRIIAKHEGEKIYSEDSPIYAELEREYPKELWRSHTKEGDFRPLFRDYPNSWTRTGVVSLANQQFHVTELGKKVISGNITKTELLINMFKKHTEQSGANSALEKPFAVLAAGLISTPRALTTKEIYWAIMKNYRPGKDDLPEFIKKKLKLIRKEPEATPYRRLRNMLTLMRAADAITSTRKTAGTIWNVLNLSHLNNIKQ